MLGRLSVPLVPRRLGEDGGGNGDDDCPGPTYCYDDEKGGRAGAGFFPALGLIVALGVGDLIYHLFKTAIRVFPDRFPALPGDDNDNITLSAGPGRPGLLTVSMTLGPAISWWKSATVYDAAGTQLGDAWSKRDEGMVTNSVDIVYAELTNGFLVLKKAKAWGVHTSMYVIYWSDLSAMGLDGKTLSFTWNSGD
jgi:hypothetical protein